MATITLERSFDGNLDSWAAYENLNAGANATPTPNPNQQMNQNANPNVNKIMNEIANLDAQAAQPRILIADDQPDVLEALRALLKGHGYRTELASSPAAIIEAISNCEFDVILMDLNYARDTTSGREGLDVLARVKESANAAPIVVMTGWATVNLAVEVMQRGVGDFVEKPWSNAKLLQILRDQIELGRQRRQARERAAGESREHDKIKLQLGHQERELGEARAIQQGFLPKSIPQMSGYEIAATWQPARIVGGDYYDVIPFGEDAMGLCIADVAGKGMPAAMLMSNLQAAVRALACRVITPDSLCERLNVSMHQNIVSDRFVTFFYAQLDGASRELRYTNAGHNTPILMHRDGSHERLDAGGGVVGVFPKQAYLMGTLQLAPGDRVVLFTDGVTEACVPNGEEFGEPRLLQLIQENRETSAHELQKKILNAAAEFSEGNWHDDATVLVIAVAG
jgi:sigma-B regulation protein RsbU (phosphoserine phosphatase)